MRAVVHGDRGAKGRVRVWSFFRWGLAGGEVVSHPILRSNQMLIVCVPRNQVYTHTVQKMDTE
jgi:hypothetical protein